MTRASKKLETEVSKIALFQNRKLKASPALKEKQLEVAVTKPRNEQNLSWKECKKL
jgi:hypothetical protein